MKSNFLKSYFFFLIIQDNSGFIALNVQKSQLFPVIFFRSLHPVTIMSSAMVKHLQYHPELQSNSSEKLLIQKCSLFHLYRSNGVIMVVNKLDSLSSLTCHYASFTRTCKTALHSVVWIVHIQVQVVCSVYSIMLNSKLVDQDKSSICHWLCVLRPFNLPIS